MLLEEITAMLLAGIVTGLKYHEEVVNVPRAILRFVQDRLG